MFRWLRKDKAATATAETEQDRDDAMWLILKNRLKEDKAYAQEEVKYIETFSGPKWWHIRNIVTAMAAATNVKLEILSQSSFWFQEEIVFQIRGARCDALILLRGLKNLVNKLNGETR